MGKSLLLLVAFLTLPLASCKTTQTNGEKLLIDGADFQDIDSNRSGSITESELDKHYKNLFNVMDINRNEKVDFSEFKVLADVPHVLKMRQFRAQSGSDPVALKMIENMEKTYPKVVKEQFAELDSNKDGNVNFSEYLKQKNIVKKEVMKNDADEDGEVTLTEIKRRRFLRNTQFINHILADTKK